MNKSPLKHSLWVRWTHWINFPLIALMVGSGILIYWANDVYRPFFPQWFYDFFRIEGRLAEGLSLHFAVMWLFLFNGLVYVAYLAVSGEWRELRPERKSLREALQVTLHDLGIVKEAPPQGKFNAAQRIAYSSITILSFFLILTGLAIYKPVQLAWIAWIFGGYESARLIHFILMLAVVAFFLVHLAQVARAGFANFSAMITGFEIRDSRGFRRAWLSFVVAVAFAVFFVGGFSWLNRQKEADGLPWPYRVGLDLNGQIWGHYLNPKRVAPLPTWPKAGTEPRFNGDIGLTSEINVDRWRLHLVPVMGPGADTTGDRLLTLGELRKLPRTETATQFKCIEGWSDIISYAGVRFTDFMGIYGVGKKPDGSYYRYVALETPDRQYYVSIDMRSMLQPQVVLAYEMNGRALSGDHGAPLRLIIPNKYGIKNLKRIGRIYFSDQRPPDYWEEQGYDWFAGL
jgi:thiosulfate reductase cytochrome b subunit/DMSO/TMAO reductase YedYZ molybdopterin-dependent catalytic subunit